MTQANPQPNPRSAGISSQASSSSSFWCCGFGGWAGTTQLSGALIAPGQIVVNSNVKKVQHPTGGIVGEVRVREGDSVKIGDIVVRLDDTITRANLSIVTKGLNELTARKARLEAERDGVAEIEFPKILLDAAAEPEVRKIMDAENEAVRAAPHRARRPEIAVAPAYRAASGGNHRPYGAAQRQAEGSRTDRARA